MNIRTPVTLLVLLGILFAGAYYGWQSLFATETGPSQSSPSPSCTQQSLSPGQHIRPRDVKVSVFNAGNRVGLAGSTMGILVQLGFREGTVANAPPKARVKNVVIRSHKPKSPEVRLLATQFKGKIRTHKAKRNLGPGVDVLLGNGFKGVKRHPPHQLTIRHRAKVCVSSPTPGG